MTGGVRWGTAALVVAHAAAVLAQGSDLSGTWKLDASQSQVAASAGLGGLIGSGAPDTLHVTQPANGTVVVESQINESHARIYAPGRTTSTPVTVGPAGSITIASRWAGGTLVGEGTRESTSGPSKVVTDVKEAFTLSSDGRVLTIEVTTKAGSETSTSTLVYRRTTDVGSCRSWPTPCKIGPPNQEPGSSVQRIDHHGTGREDCMSFLNRLLGKSEPPKPRVRVCVECGMPVAEHKDWCSILQGQRELNLKNAATATDH